MMSKMISRRVFLKATGLAVLSAAAAGALAGCGGGGANPTPGSPLAPEIDSSEVAEFGRPTQNTNPIMLVTLTFIPACRLTMASKPVLLRCSLVIFPAPFLPFPKQKSAAWTISH